MTTAAPPSTAAECLERTRSAVLNVLVITGSGIALSGGLLRWRDGWAWFRAPEGVGQGLVVALGLAAVSSYAVRRLMSGRKTKLDPARRASRFYLGHVLSAVLAALGVPLGLAYGWFLRPRLDAVGPFWIAALALGFLALPRAREIDDLVSPTSPPPS